MDEAAATELANVQTAVVAGMVDAGVFECAADGTFGPEDDFTIATGFLLSDYILNGTDGVSGTYTINTDGEVTQD